MQFISGGHYAGTPAQQTIAWANFAIGCAALIGAIVAYALYIRSARKSMNQIPSIFRPVNGAAAWLGFLPFVGPAFLGIFALLLSLGLHRERKAMGLAYPFGRGGHTLGFFAGALFLFVFGVFISLPDAVLMSVVDTFLARFFDMSGDAAPQEALRNGQEFFALAALAHWIRLTRLGRKRASLTLTERSTGLSKNDKMAVAKGETANEGKINTPPAAENQHAAGSFFKPRKKGSRLNH